MKPSESAAVLEKAFKTISRYRMLVTGDRVIAAVSGGPDSMCLLYMLREIAPQFGAKLAGAAHLNHKLRGEESDEDERFVARAAADLGVAFYRAEARLSETPGNLEQAARRARQDFFGKLIRDGAAERIATGHTLDDQAETVLFRLLRGVGPSGLAGILPARAPALVRPLLNITRVEVEGYLRSRKIAWREDATNRDFRFSRNRIRHGLLPQLAREWNPRISEVLAHTANIAADEEIWWEAEIGRIASEVLIEADGGVEAKASEIASLPRAVGRRLIRRIIPGLDFEHVEQVLELAEKRRGEGRLEFCGVTVQRSFDWLRFGRGQAETCPTMLQIPGRYPWPGGYICLGLSAPVASTPNCASLKVRGISELSPLELRTWRAGDHYRPARGHREYTIQELFQRARVPYWRRRVWPIVSAGPKILWARQFGAAAEFAAQAEEGSALRIWEENKDENVRSGESLNPEPAS